MNKLLNKIFWKSKWELVFAGIGFFIGLFMFLFCIQIYMDIDWIFNSRLGLESQLDYIVISKKINPASLRKPGFSAEELDELRSRDFVLDMGKIIANAFQVRAGVSMMGMGFQTELFFEALPDRFLDEIPEGWKWEPGDRRVPVIISRDFLLLYNFGFSQARGFPLLSEDNIKIVPMSLTISGGGDSMRFQGKISGMSDRVASILVPESFMNWANQNYGAVRQSNPLRVIISVKDRSNPDIIRFIQEKNYETSKEKLRLSDAGFTIKIILGIVATIGLFLIVLSFIIFITSFRLIISRSKEEVKLLIELGYTKKILLGNLLTMLGILLGIVTAALVFSLWIAISGFHGFLLENGINNLPGLHLAVIPVGILFVLLAFGLNYISLSEILYEERRH